MPRKARVVVANTAHHVVQRGNYQQTVFEKIEDFRIYSYLIREYAQKFNVRIHAYCLMNNHVHFILTPTDHLGLSELFKIVHLRFSQYKNLEKKRLGHLWQARFYSCILGTTHLWRAIRYVEMNPVRARIVRKPWEYLWSSARQHIGLEKSPIIHIDFPADCLLPGLNAENWHQYLMQEDQFMIKEMRCKTQKGLAVGEDDFIINLEKTLGVYLRERKAGRPKK